MSDLFHDVKAPNSDDVADLYVDVIGDDDNDDDNDVDVDVFWDCDRWVVVKSNFPE